MSIPSEVQVLQELNRAIQTVLEPNTSKDDRKAAQEYCDNISSRYGNDLLFPLTLRIIRSKEQNDSFSHSLSLRMFALKLLEEMVKDMKILDNVSTIPSVRDEVYSLLTVVLPANSSSSFNKQASRESKLMQDKIVSVLVQLTIRIWPQYWPELMDSLLGLLSLNPLSIISGSSNSYDVISPSSQGEMSLSIIRGIIDEIHPRVVDIGFLGMASSSSSSMSTMNMDSTRRSELQKAIGHEMPKILQTIFPLINSLSSPFWKCIRNQMYSEISPYLVSYSIQLLELWISVTYWTPLEPFKESVVDCWKSILCFLDTMVDIVLENSPNNEDYILSFQHCLDAMLNFIARPQKPQEVQFGLTEEIYSSLLGPLTSSLTKLSTSLPGASRFDDDCDFQESVYNYFKQLTDILVTASNTHVIPSIINSKDLVFLPPMYELMFNLASMDSLMIKSMVASFWSIHLRNIASSIATLLASKSTRSSSKASISSKEALLPLALKDKLDFLMDYCMIPLSKMSSNSDASKDTNLSTFDDIDFSTEGEEYSTLYATNQNRAMEILRSISSLAPNEICKLLTMRLSTFLSSKITSSSNDFTFAPAFISEQRPQELGEWEALCWAVDCSLKPIYSTLKEKDLLVDDWVREVCGSLLSISNMISPRTVNVDIFNSTGADVIFKWILPQRLMIPCLDLIGYISLNNDSLVQDSKAYLSLLLRSLFEITLKFESKTAEPSLSLAVKSRAGTTLLKASQTRVQPFIDSLGWLVGLFQGIPQNFDGGSERERRLFSDLLLSIATGHIVNETNNCEKLSCQLLQLVGEPLINMLSLLKESFSKEQISEMVRCPSSLNMQWNSFLAQFQSTMTIIKKLKTTLDSSNFPELKGMIAAFCVATLSILDNLIVTINYMTVEGTFDSLYSSDNNNWRNCSLLESSSGIISASSSAEDLMKISNSSIDSGPRWFWMLRVSLYVNYGITSSFISGNEQPSSCEVPLHYLFPPTFKDIEVWTLQIKHIWTPLLVSMTSLPDRILPVQAIRHVMNSIICVFGQSVLSEGYSALAVVEDQIEEEKRLEAILGAGLQSLLSLLYDILLPPSTERDKRVDPLLHTGGFLLISGQISSDLNVDSLPPGSQSSLAVWLMSPEENNDLLLQIIALLANMLRWNSSVVCGKIVNILSRWLPYILLAKSTQVRPILHEYMLGEAVSAFILHILSQASLADFHPSCLNFVVEIYKWQIFFQTDILDSNIIKVLGEEKGRSIVMELRNSVFSPPPTSVYPTQSTVNSQCRQQRIKTRQVLSKALLQSGQGKIDTIIPKLPDSMVLLGRLKKQQKELLSIDDNDDDNGGLTLDSIFE